MAKLLEKPPPDGNAVDAVSGSSTCANTDDAVSLRGSSPCGVENGLIGACTHAVPGTDLCRADCGYVWARGGELADETRGLSSEGFKCAIDEALFCLRVSHATVAGGSHEGYPGEGELPGRNDQPLDRYKGRQNQNGDLPHQNHCTVLRARVRYRGPGCQGLSGTTWRPR